jgi:hypothetical protein
LALLWGVFLLLVFPLDKAHADILLDALAGGKVSADIRYRYEWVDQANLSKKANGSTIRTRLGYETGSFQGFLAYLEFEDITVVGDERYNNTHNGKTQFPVVADPKDTEVNQAFLKYSGLQETIFHLGRRRLILDNARFVGNVGWRQNEQTFDLLSLENTTLPNISAIYAYIFNVNRIFGDHHPTSADISMDTHLINISFSQFKPVTLTAYGYLLDLNDTSAASTKTFGLRLNGSTPISEETKILYAGEFADQSDFANGASTNDATYWMAELGGTFRILTVKISYEELGGDGVYGFSTPLATLHAFQGWTDKFLATPANGIRDLFFTVSTHLMGVKLAAVYHDFSSDKGSFDYGTELGFLATKTFNNRYTLLAKYALYDADGNSQNTGGTAINTDKLWLAAQVKF